jgi:imidazoleglycerol-phosphate dehydratase
MADRIANIKRETKETSIEVVLDLDGQGNSEIETGIPFLNHMLELFAKHGLFDLKIKAQGDLEIDAHHTVEDIGICLGQSLKQAVGDKKGIKRFGDSTIPMDESLVLTAVDISGRPHLEYDVDLPVELIGTFDTTLTPEFLQALVNEAGLTLHVKVLAGRNAHHIIEAIFKGLARTLRQAVKIDHRVEGVPSTKGTL